MQDSPSTKSIYSKHMAFLCVLVCCYLLIYFAHPALPGNNERYPLGWWGWFDQGEYLKAAKALVRLDFDSKNYLYPPFYPMLGAVFVAFAPMHAFTIINLACFTIFAHFFIKFAQRYFGWYVAAALFVFSFFPDETIRSVWVEPWSTTVVAAIYSYLFYDVDRHLTEKRDLSISRLALWGGLGGLVFATRPVDAVAISSLFIFLIWYLWSDLKNKNIENYRQNYFYRAASIMASGMLGVLMFFIFNFVVHGSLGGRYFSMAAETNGFHFFDLIEKAVSIFSDAGALYNVPGDSIFARIKWAALSVPSVIYALFYGRVILRIIATTILLQLLIYLPYADLLPLGVWKYQNIHYFKWLFPYAIFIIVWSVRDIYFRVASRSGSVLLPVICFSLGFVFIFLKIDLVDVDLKSADKTSFRRTGYGVTLSLSSEGEKQIDKISFPALQGGFQEAYMSSGGRVILDGRELKYLKEFRFIPASNGVDLLFIRPVSGKELFIDPGVLRFDDGDIDYQVFRYKYAMGWPAWFLSLDKSNIKSLGPRYATTLDQGIDFSRDGYPRFLLSVTGVSGVENWGRWSDTDPSGKVEFVFRKAFPENFVIELNIKAFGPNFGKPVRVKVGNMEQVIIIDEGQKNGIYKLEFRGVIDANKLEIFVPNPVRPMDINSVSDDSRRIGIGFISLRIIGPD